MLVIQQHRGLSYSYVLWLPLWNLFLTASSLGPSTHGQFRGTLSSKFLISNSWYIYKCKSKLTNFHSVFISILKTDTIIFPSPSRKVRCPINKSSLHATFFFHNFCHKHKDIIVYTVICLVSITLRDWKDKHYVYLIH